MRCDCISKRRDSNDAFVVLARDCCGLRLGSRSHAEHAVYDASSKLTIADLLDTLLALGLGYALSVVFQRSFSEGRAEKDLSIAQVAVVRNAAIELSTAFRSTFIRRSFTEQDIEEIHWYCRHASFQLTALERAAKACWPRHEDIGLEHARKAFRNMRAVATETLHVHGAAYSDPAKCVLVERGEAQ